MKNLCFFYVLWGRGSYDGDLLVSWRAFCLLGDRLGKLFSLFGGCMGSILEALCAFGALFGLPPPHEGRQTNRIWGPREGVRGGVLFAVCWKSGDLVNV